MPRLALSHDLPVLKDYRLEPLHPDEFYNNYIGTIYMFILL
jgi:hypothetical protein